MTTMTGIGRSPLAKLRDAAWMDVIKACYLILIGGMLLGLAVDSEVRREIVKPLSLVLAVMLFVAKDLSGAPEALQRWRTVCKAGQGGGAQLCAFLPPGLVGLMRVDRAMWRGCLAWLRRRANVVQRPGGTPLHYLQQGSYSTVIGIALVSLLVELPLTAMIIPVFGLDPALKMKLHILLAAGCAYSLVWVIGDRWHVKSGYHVLTEDALDLHIGARAHGRIPLASIVRCERLAQSRQQWCRRNGVKLRETMVVSPIDGPNLVLTLAPEGAVRLTLFGVEREAPAHVFLYVDRPELLVQRLRA